MATWRELITQEMTEHGESFGDVESIVFGTFESWTEDETIQPLPQEEELDRWFNEGYGGTDGFPFTLWTAKRVYFPACYDGSEWCASVPRHPSEEATKHVGGG